VEIRNFYTNFHLKDGFRVKLTSYKGEIIKEVALTLFTSYDAYRTFAPHAQVQYLILNDKILVLD